MGKLLTFLQWEAVRLNIFRALNRTDCIHSVSMHTPMSSYVHLLQKENSCHFNVHISWYGSLYIL